MSPRRKKIKRLDWLMRKRGKVSVELLVKLCGYNYRAYTKPEWYKCPFSPVYYRSQFYYLSTKLGEAIAKQILNDILSPPRWSEMFVAPEPGAEEVLTRYFYTASTPMRSHVVLSD